MLPGLAEIREAGQRVHETLPPTPQLCWPLLCERTGVEVWVKHENHQITGAFKVRGGLVLMDHLTRTGVCPSGVITATRGNHGQSIAFAAKRHDVRCFIVVPHGNSIEKNLAMRSWGAEVIEHGNDFDDAAEFADNLARDRQLYFIASFQRLLVQGVASYWLEFFESVHDLDAVYVPIGLGSGICAGIAVRDALGLKTKMIGVVASASPAYAVSYDAGHVVEQPTATVLADGVAVRQPNGAALEIIRHSVERIVRVSEAEIQAAMCAYFTDTHNVAEGAAATPLAALMKERARMKGQRVGIVLTGGNVDHQVFAEVLRDAS